MMVDELSTVRNFFNCLKLLNSDGLPAGQGHPKDCVRLCQASLCVLYPEARTFGMQTGLFEKTLPIILYPNIVIAISMSQLPGWRCSGVDRRGVTVVRRDAAPGQCDGHPEGAHGDHQTRGHPAR